MQSSMKDTGFRSPFMDMTTAHAGFAHGPDPALEVGGLRSDNRARVAQITHELLESAQIGGEPTLIGARELHQEQGAWLAPDEFGYGVSQIGDLPGQIQKRSVHELYGGGLELHDGAHGLQGSVEIGEGTHSQDRDRRQGSEL